MYILLKLLLSFLLQSLYYIFQQLQIRKHPQEQRTLKKASILTSPTGHTM